MPSHNTQTNDGAFALYSTYGQDKHTGVKAPIPLLFYKAGHYDLLVHRSAVPQARL